MNNKRVLIDISKILFIIFLPIVTLFTILQYYSYNQDFYMNEFEKYNISKVTTMSEEDLSRVSEKLISYLKLEYEDLDIKAVINGEYQEVFGQREKQHMVDVKELFSKGKRLRNTGLCISLLAFVTILLVSKSRKRDIYKALLWSGIVSLLLMLILYILLSIDFYKYFTYFHEIFFTNDLWLLNPKTEVLIQMLPLEFFIDISIRIIGWFLGISIAMVILPLIKLKKYYLNFK
ncbi:TIGR01906 family membrane protein [Wukongibacter sp. M2B1]|uniref:TIGR01906 family membrane protein n=1 Tax=Wukongibacter sp. M2B1 TaxID=3088895 RepID=UPI003D798408